MLPLPKKFSKLPGFLEVKFGRNVLFKKHTILLFLLLLLFWDIGQLADLLSLMTSMIKDAQRGAVQQKIGEQTCSRSRRFSCLLIILFPSSQRNTFLLARLLIDTTLSE